MADNKHSSKKGRNVFGAVAAGVAGLAVGAAAATLISKHPKKVKKMMQKVRRSGRSLKNQALRLGETIKKKTER